jgi:hypothetical protein
MKSNAAALAAPGFSGHHGRMKETLSLDASGGLYIPPEVIADNHLAWVEQFELFMAEGNLVLRPVVVPRPCSVEVNEDGLPVIRSGFPITDEQVIWAIHADRK